MKNNRTVFILILVFIVLIFGAGFLYQKLTAKYQPDSFVIINGDNKNTTVSSAEEITSSEVDASLEYEDSSLPSDEESETLQAAPDFLVYDSLGNEVRLSDFSGKPVVLNFWASWCGPCKSEMPGFDNLYQKYGDSIEFIMVNLTDGMQETQEKAESFIHDAGYTFPVYFDSDSNAAYTYGISSIPTTFLINVDGEIEAYAMGAISEEALENALDMILESEN